MKSGTAVLQYPAVVTVFDPDLGVEDALPVVAVPVRDAIDGWYERPETYTLSLAEVGECREGLG